MMNDDEMRWEDVIQATSILPDWLLLICSGDMKKKNENRSTATANKWVPLESIIIVQQSIGPRRLSGSSLNKPPDPLAGEHWTTPTRPPSVQVQGLQYNKVTFQRLRHWHWLISEAILSQLHTIGLGNRLGSWSSREKRGRITGEYRGNTENRIQSALKVPRTYL